MRRFTFAAMAACLTAAPLSAHDFKIGDLTIGHPYSFETTTNAMSAIGYLSITNNGSEPDVLVDVEAPFDRIMLHKTDIDGQGVATMSHQGDGILIAPGETIMLEPGGLHVMFMGLGGDPLEEGETFNATLVFERAGPVDVVFNVEARGAGVPEMDHSHHGMQQDDAMAAPFALGFQAVAAGVPVTCSSTIKGLGPDSNMTVGLNDLRFYVSGVTFGDAAGNSYPAVLDENPFQLVHDAGSVAMIDLTSNTDGTCAPGSISFGEGTARTNDTVTGTIDGTDITTVTFDVGVPQALMQAVIAAGTAEDAPSPMAEMYWNWASGYRHFVLNHTVDVTDGTYGEGYIHIGSHDCGPAEGKALSDRDRCGYLNTAQVTLPVTDPTAINVALDLDAVFSGLDFRAPIRDMETREIIGEQPGTSCHGMKMQADCAVVFNTFGIDLESGASDAAQNVAFKVMP